MPEKLQWNLLRELTNALRDDNRYVDVALQLVAVGPDGKTEVRRSVVYGGVWDRFERRYDPDRTPESIDVEIVSEKQFAILTDADVQKKLVGAGRGFGKTRLEAVWCKLRACKRPGRRLQVSAPTYGHATNVWSELLPMMPQSWLLPGKDGIRKAARQFALVTGTVISFMSTDNPNTTRGKNNADCANDEAQDISIEASDNIKLTMRVVEDWEYLSVGTAEAGSDFHDLAIQYEADPNGRVYNGSSYDNPFIPHDVFRDSEKHMDPKRYQREVLGLFVAQESLVYHCFDRGQNVREWDPRRNKLLRDVTVEVLQRRIGVESLYCIGQDYNVEPMWSLILKIVHPNILWVIDEVVIDDEAEAKKAALELIRRGYGESVMIDDASGQYSQGGKSSSRIMREHGFHVVHGRRNPKVIDRVNAVNAKFCNARGERTLFIDPKCRRLIRAAESQTWVNGKPNKETGHDHPLDALGYVVHHLYPAGLKGADAKRAIHGHV